MSSKNQKKAKKVQEPEPEVEEEEVSSEEEKVVKKGKKAETPAKSKKSKKADSDEEEEEKVAKKGKKAEPKKAEAKSKKPAKVESEEESEEEEVKPAKKADKKSKKAAKADSDDEAEEMEEEKKAESDEESEEASSESSNIVYLKNLSYDATEDDILAIFEDIGVPTLDIQRGYGTATFETAEEAKQALEKDGSELAGRKMYVKSEDVRVQREERSNGDRPEKHGVFVGALSFDTTEDTVREFFSDCGEITGCRLLTDRETGRSKGCAFLDFSTKEEAQAALAKNGEELDGRTIKTDLSNQSGGGSRGGRGRGGFRGGDRGGYGGRGGFRGGDRGGRGRGGFGGRGGDRGGRGGRGGFRGGRGSY